MADFKVDLTDPNFNAQLVSLGVTGTIHYAPYGTDAPEGLEAYEAPYVNLGWISDEGLTEAISRESNSFTPWQSNSPVREAASSEEFTFSATLWTIGGLANAMRYGVPESEMDYNEEGKFAEFTQGGDLPEEFRYGLGFDILDGSKHRRFLLPAASAIDPSDVTYQKGDLIGYPMTWRANVDNALGYSILRRFKEGWRPGYVGADGNDDLKVRDLGDWSKRSASAPADSGTASRTSGGTTSGGSTANTGDTGTV